MLLVATAVALSAGEKEEIVGDVTSGSVSKVNRAPPPPSLLSISKETSSVLPLLAITVTVEPETVASRIEE